MKLDTFIEGNLDAIVAEWDAFARTLLPAPEATSDLVLPNHSREILITILKDMRTPAHSDGCPGVVRQVETTVTTSETMAAAHGALRHQAGFDLAQLISEFRTLRSSVFARWRRDASARGTNPTIDEVDRFNNAVDQALTESVERYASNVAAARDMFLAVLGHDLRSPLQSIEMARQVLASPGLSEAARLQTAMRVGRASKMMDVLITDLLQCIRGRLGFGMPIERAECDLRAACNEALDIAKANDPNRKFIEHISGDLQAHADGARLREALSNLLSNAVQHGDKEAPITLRALGEKDVIILSVANSGKPIPLDALRIIFDPLVQVPATTSDLSSRSKTSLGLGLFIAREIVLSHGGAIDARSSAEAGTVFTIRLPRGDS